MADSNETDSKQAAADEALFQLYEQSKEAEEVEIPERLDNLILQQAREAVAVRGKDGAVTVVPFLRRRWEIPVSVAATIMIATLLFIDNRGALPPVLDSGVPEAVTEEALFSDAVLQESGMEHKLEIKSGTTEAAGVALPAEEEPPSLATEKKWSSPATAVQSQPSMRAQSIEESDNRRPAIEQERRVYSAPARETAADMAPATMGKKKFVSGDKQRAEVESQRALEENNERVVAPEAWLSRIDNLIARNQVEQAHTELERFRLQYPEYPLQSFCLQHAALCEME